MNALDKFSRSAVLNEDDIFGQILVLFPLESIQHLDVNSALRCQKILGHGERFGFWETPEEMIPRMRITIRRIDFRRRLSAYLPKGTKNSNALDTFLDEGVLWLTRMALLMRMGPVGLGTRKFKPLDPGTIAAYMFQHLPKLVARGAIRRLEDTANLSTGLASALTTDDLQEFWAIVNMRSELKRLTQLHDLGIWSDAPAAREFKGKTTAVRGAFTQHPPERKSIPHPAIPDDYLEAMGPRVMWLIKDLGPNVIHMLETLPLMLTSSNAASYTIGRRINRYFETNVWRDRNGQVIEKPPFHLQHGSRRGLHNLKFPAKHNAFNWPPNNWSSIQALAVSLQSAHLWMALLVMAARIGEVATLGRDCIEFARDGQFYANGKTYKPSSAFAGRNREWPVPEILVEVFAQQVKLVEASERLARIIKDTEEMAGVLGDSTHLWASLGASGSADATKKLADYGENLQTLALRIGLTHKPGGKNLHPHRFRKTLARLAGLAIDGSQKVLMLLLGHADVTTTLGYMQTDPAFAKEVDDITRELRVIRGEALIEDMRVSLRDPKGLPFGGHGGGGAPVLAEAVGAYEEELHRTGQEWGVDTARELSVLLTNNGESARLISPHVVCTKTTGEVGLCSSKKGAIVAGNCQPECRNHIEDKAGRRDTERVIPILVKHAQESIANNDWLPLARDKKQLDQELKRYDDIGALWRAKPEVRAILEAAT